MSLLQEALKRKELEEAQHKPETGSAEKAPAALPPDDANLSAGRQDADSKNTVIPQDSPPQSMPVLTLSQSAASQPARRSLGAGGSILAAAEPLAKPGRRKTSLLWVIVAAIAILTGLTVTAGFVFFIYRWLTPMEAKIGQQAYHINKTDTIVANGTNMVIAQSMPADKQKTVNSAETMPRQSGAPNVKDVEKASIVTAVPTQVMQNAAQQQSIGDTAPKPVSIKPTPVKPAPVRAKAPPPPAFKWPALKLMGILRGSGPAESTAFINGRMISAGQTIDGVTVVEIKADGIRLKHGAEEKFLRVGATLY